MEVITEQQKNQRRAYFDNIKIDAIKKSNRLSSRQSYDVLTGDGDFVYGLDSGNEPYNEPYRE